MASFVIAIAGGIAAVVGYATENTGDLLGLGLAVAATGIGLGLVAWSKHLDLSDHVVQQREPLEMQPADRADLDDEIDKTADTLGRRPLLVWLSGLSVVSLLAGFVGPIGSLGPKPRGERSRTAWRAGIRLVTPNGQPISSAGGSMDQLATVFPLGHLDADDAQVILLRLAADLLEPRTVEHGAVDGWVAYSKICTHAGCSVGLFGIDNRGPDVVRQLVCPCHQSVFDPLDGARPLGGPATRSLPQLPLAVDDDGFLIAADGFEGPVGPIAWNEA